jgi:hypothetical protein
MALRKSDKIIAVIGIVILIIAGIGIFVYMDTEDDNGDKNGDADKMKFYPVESKMTMNPLPDESQSRIRLPILRGADFSFNHDIMDENVKNITVTVGYTDENPGLLGRFLNLGKDTLTINVVDSEGNNVGSGTKTGSGRIEFDIVGTATEIQESIEAKSYEDANQMLEDMYEPFSETYTFNINVKGGLIGALRERILGRDSFTLKVSYCTYKYSLEQPLDDDGDNPNTETNFDPPVFHTTNYPGYH